MAFFEAPKLEVGNVLVATTNNKGHDPEFWAQTIANRIVSVGGNCHPTIAQQAEAFKEQVFHVVKHYMQEAVKSNKTDLIAECEQGGYQDIAEILRKI